MRFCPMCGRRQSSVIGAARPATARGGLLGELCESETLLGWRRAFELLVALCDAVTESRRGHERALERDSFYVEQRGGMWSASILDADHAPLEPHDTDVMRAPPPWLGNTHCDYWPPERTMGKSLTPASDVYTLGVIAYELLVGHRPFADVWGPVALITAQLKHVPVAPSIAISDISVACDPVVMRCLHKDPRDRFGDARAVADAARAVLETEPVAVPIAVRRRPSPPSPPARSRGAAAPPRAPVQIVPAKSCGSATCSIGHRLIAPANATLAGSWLFLDHFDSVLSRRPESDPHPHVGVAVATYLFDGRLVHRDSLGNVQRIDRGGLSWMVAGRGAVHSERDAPSDRAHLHGLELWAVVPRPNEDDPPTYAYHRASALPSVVIGGVRVRVVVGDGFGVTSPVVAPAPLSMFDAHLPAKTAVPVPAPRYHDYQRAVYVVSGSVEIDEVTVEARQLAVIAPGASVGVRAGRGKAAHIIGLGSAPVLGPRHTWWHFSSTSAKRIEEVKRRWGAGDLGAVPGETAPTPLPSG